MNTIRINRQAISEEAHKALKRLANRNLWTFQQALRTVLHKWAIRQNKKEEATNGK
jgi:predicted nucleic acid-binding Zn ribbon protein